jgi:type III secretion protein S
MNADHIVYLAQQILVVAALCSAPVVVVAALVGLLVGILQSVFSVQDASLAHAFRAFAVLVVIVVTAPWVGTQLTGLGDLMFSEMLSWRR